jgi:hypothetical protein
MAMMEIRLLISTIILNYEYWIGVPDKLGEWDKEMKPTDSTILHPNSGKCVLRFKKRV